MLTVAQRNGWNNSLVQRTGWDDGLGLALIFSDCSGRSKWSFWSWRFKFRRLKDRWIVHIRRVLDELQTSFGSFSMLLESILLVLHISNNRLNIAWFLLNKSSPQIVFFLFISKRMMRMSLFALAHHASAIICSCDSISVSLMKTLFLWCWATRKISKSPKQEASSRLDLPI